MPEYDEHHLLQAVATIVADMLPYAPRANHQTTKLHDAIWGTVTLAPHEAALLDTPLLQRLRHLRQLSLAYLVFPSAHHTRFEHTLGVIHITTLTCRALAQLDASTMSAHVQDNLRFAALCHDLGHGPFSHCSELYFKDLAPMPEMLARDGGHAAEWLAAQIVLSAPMRQFIATLNCNYGTELDCEYIAAAIQGRLPDDRAYQHEIIHGPFDADKIDYLARDSRFCGLSTHVDAERILNELEIGSHAGKRRLVGRRGAAAALMQLVHCKHYLYAVVYQHTVTRAASAMLHSALRCAHKDGTAIAKRLIELATDFLRLDDAMLLTPDVIAPGRAADLCAALRERRLFKAALTIEGHRLDPSTRSRLEDEARSLATTIASVAGIDDHLVTISPAPRQSNVEASSLLLRQHNSLVQLGDIMALPDTTEVPLHKLQERHLVLSPSEHRATVAAAARTVLGEIIDAQAFN